MHRRTHRLLTFAYALSSLTFAAAGVKFDRPIFKITGVCQSFCSFQSDYVHAFQKSTWKPVDRTLASYHTLVAAYFLRNRKLSRTRKLVATAGGAAFLSDRLFIRRQNMTGVKIAVCLWHYLTPLALYKPINDASNS